MGTRMENSIHRKKLPNPPAQDEPNDAMPRTSSYSMDVQRRSAYLSGPEATIDYSTGGKPDSSSERRPNPVRRDDTHRSLNKSARELEKVEAELEKALIEKALIEKEWKEATSELNKLHADRNYKVDDEFFVQAWRGLRYEIKDLAFQHFDGEPKRSISFGQTPRHITDVAYNYKLYLRSSQLRPLLMQAVVWHILIQRCFFTAKSSTGLLWTGANFAYVKPMFDLLDPGSGASPAQLKDFHKWRADTATLLEPRVSEHGIKLKSKEVADFMYGQMSAFVTSKDLESLRSGLVKVVLKAAQLDLEFQKQRAVFRPWRPESRERQVFGYQPTPNEFENDDGLDLDPERIVELVVAPGLGKTGSADGDRYDVETVLVRCRIVQEGSLTSQESPKAPSPLQQFSDLIAGSSNSSRTTIEDKAAKLSKTSSGGRKRSASFSGKSKRATEDSSRRQGSMWPFRAA